MTRISFFRRDAVRPTEEQRLLTRQFYQNASAIYSSYNDWKDDDSIYFIPLYLEMTYSIGGKVLEIAPLRGLAPQRAGGPGGPLRMRLERL